VRKHFSNEKFRCQIFSFEGTIDFDSRTKFKAKLAYQTYLNEQFSLSNVYEWLDTLIASLDCYTWTFSQGFLNPLLFHEEQSRLFSGLSYFITRISMSTLDDLMKSFPSSNQTQVFTPTDISQYET